MSWQSYVDDHLMAPLSGALAAAVVSLSGAHDDTHLAASIPSNNLCGTKPIAGGGTLSGAAIVGQDGGVWAQTPDFPAITPEQVAAIMEGLEDPAKLGATGIHIGGPAGSETKYFLIPSEAGSVLRGRFKNDGVVIKKTTSALVIGLFSEGVPAGDANVRVEDLGDYLVSQGI